jgi:uncharacterized protein with PIN domain
VQCERNLLEIVLALRSPRSLASLLNSRQQQCHQYGDNRNHNQELNQGKCTASAAGFYRHVSFQWE